MMTRAVRITKRLMDFVGATIGLVPGTYYLMARLNETWTVTEGGVEEMMGYAPTYFPGTTGTNDARRVTIGVGQIATNTNFSLIPGRAASVSGTAYDSTGRPIATHGIQMTQDMVGPNMAMIMMASAAFHAGHSEVAEIQTAYHTLTPLLGAGAPSRSAWSQWFNNRPLRVRVRRVSRGRAELGGGCPHATPGG